MLQDMMRRTIQRAHELHDFGTAEVLQEILLDREDFGYHLYSVLEDDTLVRGMGICSTSGRTSPGTADEPEYTAAIAMERGRGRGLIPMPSSFLALFFPASCRNVTLPALASPTRSG